ncbi:winged helix-turn-helix domain-containing protein [Photobacterium damselae]|uniref:winged helix-turn-helix domain-containing protein n=1 Tax=Photobacterium damselae TaxID=38293 RepID=UPI00165DAE41|nr:winged helix-turn-helix domain-containing protein [Photobacterium damselae]
MNSKKYKIDNKILSSDEPFLIDLISQEKIKLGTHEHRVLLALCEQPGKILDKEFLIQKGWPGKFVTDSSLTQAIRNIRAHINDDGKSQKHIKTIAKKGYLIEQDNVDLESDGYLSERFKCIIKQIHSYKKIFLLSSITLQLLFITFSIYNAYPIFTIKTNDNMYPNLSFHQDYLYIFSDDFQYSEKLGIELLHTLSTERVVPQRFYIMLSKNTVSYSVIEKDGTSKNKIIYTKKTISPKDLCNFIVNEIQYK